MSRGTSLPTLYFPGEGKGFMEECIRAAFDACIALSVRTAVIFTATGEGPLFALRELLTKPEYAFISVVAITPPVGRVYRADPRRDDSPLVTIGIPDEVYQTLAEAGIPVHSAHLPFKGFMIGGEPPASEWSRVEQAYGVLGGGFALCLQSVMVACDAGYVDVGDEVVAITADTAVVAIASRTESFLSSTTGILVPHIVCRPFRYDISKAQHLFLPDVVDSSDVHRSDETTSADGDEEKELPPKSEE